EVDQGHALLDNVLDVGRGAVASEMVGLSEEVFGRTVAYLKERKQFGKAIAEFQAVQHQIARAATDVEAARLLVYNAARLRESQQPFLAEAAMCKIVSSEVAERVASLAINLFGGYGFVKDYPVEKLYRDAKIGQIYEGTSNLQLQTIAKNILG
ncbi:MAG: acyl-CoA dehydrogenase, partial [Acidobacteria bacterium]|nr:acyl-CoA dehydrogenase [Acidobacteriota bacterium]